MEREEALHPNAAEVDRVFSVPPALEMYFRITGKRYDGLLGQHRRSREKTK